MLHKQIDFNKYSSIRIGNTKKVYIAQNIDEAMKLADDNYSIIGKANNTLLGPNIAKIFQLGKEFDYIKETNDFIEIGAMCSTKKAFLYFKKNNISGLEFLGSLPGSIGGAITMNAGMKEFEIKNAIISVLINGKWVDSKDINFIYRKSNINGIIFAARFYKINGFNSNLESLFKQMRNNQPITPSCGSCFKNAKSYSAGFLLDNAGLKGYKIGGMSFSKKHANFLVNIGNGSFEDAIELINIAKQKVLEKFNIELETEIVIKN